MGLVDRWDAEPCGLFRRPLWQRLVLAPLIGWSMLRCRGVRQAALLVWLTIVNPEALAAYVEGLCPSK